MLTLEKTLCNFGCIWEALFFKNNLRRNNFKKNYQNAIVNLEKCKQYSILPHPLGWAGKTKVSKFFLFVFDFFFFFPKGKILPVKNAVPSTTPERMSAGVPFLTLMREQDKNNILPFTRGLFVPIFLPLQTWKADLLSLRIFHLRILIII